MRNILIIIWLHLIGDFIFQTDKMALNKSKSNKWLLIHIMAYSSCFLWFGWQYALLNGAFHFVTDYITSRLTTWAWKEERRGLFFKIIGADQAIHLTTLILTLGYFR